MGYIININYLKSDIKEDFIHYFENIKDYRIIDTIFLSDKEYDDFNKYYINKQRKIKLENLKKC
jgi:hypothetical protein